MSGAGDSFQQETKYSVSNMGGHRLVWGAKPALYKEYPQANKTKLPSPREACSNPWEGKSLQATLMQRRSIRHFEEKPISLVQLSYLLWASTGIQRIEGGYEFRTAPSAGALYPIETYVIANDVSKLEQGLYHYSIRARKLDELQRGDLRWEITQAALGQDMCATAAAVFVWSAVFERCKWKYGQRAYRYVYLDAGHIAENLVLAAVSLNLGCCEIGALFDDEINGILGIDGEQESTILMAVVGVPA